MTTHRGQDGLLILGGELVGTPEITISYATGVSQVQITGGGSTLTGVVMVGDIFTIGAGSQSYTVGGSFFAATGNAVATLPITPVIATVVATGATVAFESHSVAELRSWTLAPALDLIEDTVKGDKHKTFQGGLAGHTGSAMAWLDAGDTYQAALLDKIAAGTPDGTVAAMAFRVAAGKFLYGAAVLSGFSIDSPDGSALVGVTFNFTISGPLTPEWH